ncbi:AEC family transporter [Rubrivivax rivuli]|uniref:AEC family transporter n=1 Tax=Rubrivivax rivuli TaxID=1862385 RepID=A0A437RQH4_9BURK|nr:AEC family transporter [Rubrivivax rivuli]RVU49054.1 AEC family transporter [Rubrivivax rivuli]
MTATVLAKLMAMFFTVGLGWLAARQRWLGKPEEGDPARVLGNLVFYLFVPALLFRTTARLDLAHMPWATLVAFFVPLVGVLLLVYLSQRRAAARHGAAAPATRAITATFGNSLQVGVPFAAAVFGEAGLAIHIALVSLHALVLLTLLTALVELDLSRAAAAQGQTAPSGLRGLARTLAQTARNTVIHPVVLPVLAGMAWNLTGLGLHPIVDESLLTLGAAVVPMCLVLIGVTLAAYGVRGLWRGALGLSAVKLLLVPAVVLVVARWGFGLTGLPLSVVVMMAALPTGSNALIFSQRYETLQAETTATIVISTAAFALTASFWLAVLSLIP